MFARDASIFLLVQIAMMCFALAEAYMEGPDGWRWNPRWWRLHLPGGYTVNSYHIIVFGLMLPVLVFGIPLTLVGWDPHLFLVLLLSYVVGIVVEDFTWFIVNPDFPFLHWGPKHVRWYPWIVWKRFQMPVGYAVVLCVGTALFFLIYHDWVTLP